MQQAVTERGVFDGDGTEAHGAFEVWFTARQTTRMMRKSTTITIAIITITAIAEIAGLSTGRPDRLITTRVARTVTASSASSGKNSPSNTASHIPYSFPAERRICETAIQPRIVAPIGAVNAGRRNKKKITTPRRLPNGPLFSNSCVFNSCQKKGGRTKTLNVIQHAAMIAVREKRDGPKIPPDAAACASLDSPVRFSTCVRNSTAVW